MGSTDAIRNFWQNRWTGENATASDLLADRFTKIAYRRIVGFFDARDRRILEVGCGTGRFCGLVAKEYPNSDVIGIDVAASALRIADRLKDSLRVPNVQFVEGSVFSLPFSDNHFDVVFSEGVICCFDIGDLNNYVDAFDEMVRVVKPGGKLIVSLPNWYCFPHTLYKWWLRKLEVPYEYGYEKSFTRKEVGDLFRRHKFQDFELTGFYPSYGFFRLASRLEARIGRFAKIFRFFGNVVDKLDFDWMSRVIGFQIIGKGVKPPERAA